MKKFYLFYFIFSCFILQAQVPTSKIDRDSLVSETFRERYASKIYAAEFGEPAFQPLEGKHDPSIPHVTGTKQFVWYRIKGLTNRSHAQNKLSVLVRNFNLYNRRIFRNSYGKLGFDRLTIVSLDSDEDIATVNARADKQNYILYTMYPRLRAKLNEKPQMILDSVYNYYRIYKPGEDDPKAKRYYLSDLEKDAFTFYASTISIWFASVGGKFIQGGDTRVSLYHEIGHNFGLGHRTRLRPSGTAFSNEAGAACWNCTNGDYTPEEKSRIGWLKSDDTYKIVTESGDYTLYRYLHYGKGYKTLQFVKNDGTSFWGAYRVFLRSEIQTFGEHGIFVGANHFGNPYWGTLEATDLSFPYMNEGLFLRSHSFTDEYDDRQVIAQLPIHPSKNRDNRPVLMTGSSHTFVEEGITITTTRLNYDKEGNYESLDIHVELGYDPANNHPPKLKLTAPKSHIQAGEKLIVTAQATDDDNDKIHYGWSVDGLFQSGDNNKSTYEFSSSADGEYLVACVASDAKGGKVTEYFLVRVGSPTNTYNIITDTIKDVKGDPVSHAYVKIEDRFEGVLATTDTNGIFKLYAKKASQADGVVYDVFHDDYHIDKTDKSNIKLTKKYRVRVTKTQGGKVSSTGFLAPQSKSSNVIITPQRDYTIKEIQHNGVKVNIPALGLGERYTHSTGVVGADLTIHIIFSQAAAKSFGDNLLADPSFNFDSNPVWTLNGSTNISGGNLNLKPGKLASSSQVVDLRTHFTTAQLGQHNYVKFSQTVGGRNTNTGVIIELSFMDSTNKILGIDTAGAYISSSYVNKVALPRNTAKIKYLLHITENLAARSISEVSLAILRGELKTYSAKNPHNISLNLKTASLPTAAAPLKFSLTNNQFTDDSGQEIDLSSVAPKLKSYLSLQDRESIKANINDDNQVWLYANPDSLLRILPDSTKTFNFKYTVNIKHDSNIKRILSDNATVTSNKAYEAFDLSKVNEFNGSKDAGRGAYATLFEGAGGGLVGPENDENTDAGVFYFNRQSGLRHDSTWGFEYTFSKDYIITQVWITNRQDRNSFLANGLQVQLLDAAGNVVATGQRFGGFSKVNVPSVGSLLPTQLRKSTSFNNIVARKIRIYSPGDASSGKTGIGKTGTSTSIAIEEIEILGKDASLVEGGDWTPKALVTGTSTLTVTGKNDAPILTSKIPNQTNNINAPIAQIDLKRHFKDPDGDSLTFTTSLDPKILNPDQIVFQHYQGKVGSPSAEDMLKSGGFSGQNRMFTANNPNGSIAYRYSSSISIHAISLGVNGPAIDADRLEGATLEIKNGGSVQNSFVLQSIDLNVDKTYNFSTPITGDEIRIYYPAGTRNTANDNHIVLSYLNIKAVVKQVVLNPDKVQINKYVGKVGSPSAEGILKSGGFNGQDRVWTASNPASSINYIFNQSIPISAISLGVNSASADDNLLEGATLEIKMGSRARKSFVLQNIDLNVDKTYNFSTPIVGDGVRIYYPAGTKNTANNNHIVLSYLTVKTEPKLPIGIDLDSITGLISGTPSQAGSYFVRVSAKDPHNETASTNFVFNILDPGLSFQLSSDTISENRPVNTVIGTLSSSHPNANHFIYGLTNELDNFTINASNQLVATASLDYEADSIYALNITVQDTSRGAFYEKKNVQVKVNNLDEAPTPIRMITNSFIIKSGFGLPAGYVLGRVTAPGEPGDTITYTLKSATADFVLVGDTLKTKHLIQFSYHINYGRDRQYNTTIRATNKRTGKYAERTFIYTIQASLSRIHNINYNGLSLSEGQDYSGVVGRFSVSETGSQAGNSFSEDVKYKLVPKSDNQNRYFRLEGNVLVLKAPFNIDTIPQTALTIDVLAKNRVGHTFEKRFVIPLNRHIAVYKATYRTYDENPAFVENEELELKSALPAENTIKWTITPDKNYTLLDSKTLDSADLKIKFTKGGIYLVEFESEDPSGKKRTDQTYIRVFKSGRTLGHSASVPYESFYYQQGDPRYGSGVPDVLNGAPVAHADPQGFRRFLLTKNLKLCSGCALLPRTLTYDLKKDHTIKELHFGIYNKNGDVHGHLNGRVLKFYNAANELVHSVTINNAATNKNFIIKLPNIKAQRIVQDNGNVGFSYLLPITEPTPDPNITWSLTKPSDIELSDTSLKASATNSITEKELQCDVSIGGPYGITNPKRLEIVQRGGRSGGSSDQEVLYHHGFNGSNRVWTRNRSSAAIKYYYDTMVVTHISLGTTENWYFNGLTLEVRKNGVAKYSVKVTGVSNNVSKTYTMPKCILADEVVLYYPAGAKNPSNNNVITLSFLNVSGTKNLAGVPVVDADKFSAYSSQINSRGFILADYESVVLGGGLEIHNRDTSLKTAYTAARSLASKLDTQRTYYLKSFLTREDGSVIYSTPLSFKVPNTQISSDSITEYNSIGAIVGQFNIRNTHDTVKYTYTLGGPDSAAFSIVLDTLKANAIFNYRTKSKYQIEIKAKSNQGITFRKDFAIFIRESKGPTAVSLSKTTVAENSPIGTLVAKLTTSDPSPGETHTYSLSGADAASFTIVRDSLRLAKVPDFETKAIYNIKVITTNTKSRSHSEEATITVTNVNEAPSDFSLSQTTVAENSPIGFLVGKLTTTDVDGGDSHTYSLSGADAGAFAIVRDSLRLAQVPDFETKASYTITLKTTDAGGETYSKNVTITVTNVNEAPTDLSLSQTTVAENRPIGFLVGKLTTADVDGGDSHTYSLSGADAGTFTIVRDSLRLAQVPNFETKASYAITLKTTDAGGETYSKNLTITITNVNEAPTDFSLSTVIIAENNNIGDSIGRFTTTDPDAGDTYTYSIIGGDAGAFSISRDSLKAAVAFDFETKSSYAITVQVEDAGGLRFSKQISIIIRNVNESGINRAPTDIQISQTSIAENSLIGFLVGRLSTTDLDADDSHVYSISGADSAAFTIFKDSLRLAQVPNFETKASYSITLKTSDSKGETYSKNFTINVTNVNETPTDLTLSQSAVPENSAVGTLIGKLSTTDEDLSDTHTYSVSGADAGAFVVVKDSLRLAQVPNFETKASYAITLRTTDAGSESHSENITITVTNINEAPTDLTLSQSAVPENSAVGTLIGKLSTTDEDLSDTHTYSVSGADAGAFVVVKDSLRLAQVPNFEIKASYAITLRTTDAGGESRSENFTITVTNVNEAPTDLSLSQNTVPENSAIGTLIGKLSTADEDVGDTHTYSISGADAGAFVVVKDSLRLAQVPNFETKASYTITLKTMDAGGESYSEDLTITVTNVNEAPSDISLSQTTIAEGSAIGTLVAKLNTSDADKNDTHTYALSGIDAASFTLVRDSLRLAKVPDFETKASYTVTLKTTDAGGESHSENVTINITNVNEPPTDLNLSKMTVVENSLIGTAVGKLSTTDIDASDIHTYTISGADASAFTISQDSLRLAQVPNFEAKASYTITLKTTDKGGLFYSKNFTITITNTNDAPANINLSQTRIAENSSIGSLVGKLSTVDDDAGDSHTYGLSGVDAASFTLARDSLRLATVPNFETKSSYTITIKSTDRGGKSYSKNFTIDISNVNEAPTSLALSKTSIAENNRIGDLVGLLTTTDSDVSDSHTYSIIGGDAAVFNISRDSLKAAIAFDFETKASYSITIQVQDAGGLRYSKQMRIDIVNIVNENVAPTAITLSQSTVNENSPIGTVVGILRTVDANQADTHKYSLSGADAAAFSVRDSNLVTSAILDFETRASYSITIRTTDSSGRSFEKQMAIKVLNVNEAPTAIILSKAEFRANSPIGTPIGLLSSQDPDTSDTHTYTIVGGDTESFAIKADTLKSASLFADIEAGKSKDFGIDVRTSDTGGLTHTQRISIKVVNDSTITSLPSLQTSDFDAIEPVVYPNPSSGSIKISGLAQLTNVNIEIINASGQVVKTYDRVQATYDLKGLSKGVYIAVINYKGKTKELVFILN